MHSFKGTSKPRKWLSDHRTNGRTVQIHRFLAALGMTPSFLFGGSPTTHEVHDFQAVAIAQLGRAPGIAADDDAIEFYGDPVGLDAQLLDQFRQRQRVAEAALFPIDQELHRETL